MQDVLEFVPLANESLKLANETVKQVSVRVAACVRGYCTGAQTGYSE